MHELKITPVALHDIQEAMDFYNNRRAGLGDRFENLLAAYFEALSERPGSGIFYKEGIRYRIVKRFPYMIFYQFGDEVLAILRVFNTYQNPERVAL